MTDQPRLHRRLSLFALSIFYGGMVCIAGVLGNKQVALGPLAVEAGIFAFLLLVVTSSSVAELHGRRDCQSIGADRIRAAADIAGAELDRARASAVAATWTRRALSAFNTMMTGTPRIWLGGILAYGVSTFLNVTIFSRLKAREGAGLLWLRAAIASVLSQIVDTLIFITVAFYGVVPDRRAPARPDACEGRSFGDAGPAPRLRLRRPRTSAGRSTLMQG